MDNLAIDIKKLTKEFLIDKNKSIPVLNGITLSAYYGEFISILGISGSGKTTLLNCMSSLSRPTEGEVRINGKDPYKLKNRQLAKIRREEISFIFQSYNLVPSLPVFENIVLPLRLSNKRVNKDKVVTFLQSLTSSHELPDLTIRFDIKTVVFSAFVVPVIVAFSAYFHSRKELKKEEIVAQKQIYKYLTLVVKGFLWFISIGIWLLCLNSLIRDIGDKSTSEVLQQTSVILFLLLIHLVFIQMMTPNVQISLLKLVSKFLPLKKYSFIIGKWNILFNPTYFKNLQASVTMGITLVSGFLLYVQNTYLGNHSDSIRESTFSFIAYLSAPILIILANTISITILSSNQDKKEISQLKILGASNKHIIMIKATEAFLHSLIIFVISSVYNLIILFSVNYGVHLLGNHMNTINSVWLPNLVLSGMVCVFYLITKLLTTKSYRNS